MSAIEARDLTKVYRTYRKESGLRGAIKGLVRRRYDETRAVDDANVVSVRRSCRRFERAGLPVLENQVPCGIEVLRRVDDSPAAQHRSASVALPVSAPASPFPVPAFPLAIRHRSDPPFAASANSGAPPASRYSTAIRTATPFVTCSRITL